MHHKHQSNGHVPNGVHAKRRIPTVDEALTYSPFTSILPFNPEIVPPPFASASTSQTSLLSSEQQASAKRVLSTLDREAGNAERASARLQRTLLDVQKLLRPDDLPTYKFKPPHRLVGRMKAPPSPITPNAGSKKDVVPLSPFAELVLETIKFPHRYPTPPGDEVPSSTPQTMTAPASVIGLNTPATDRSAPNVQAIKPVVNKPQIVKAEPRPKTVPEPAPTRSQPVVVIPHLPQEQYPPRQVPQPDPVIVSTTKQEPDFSSQGSQPGPAIILTRMLTPAEKAQYHVFEEPTVAAPSITQPAQYKTQEPVVRSDIPPMSSDQRQKAQAAIARLQGLMSEVFEGENDFHNNNSHQVFTQVDTSDGSMMILQHGYQERLERAVIGVANVKEMPHFGVDDLVRLQQLCRATIMAVSEIHLGIGEGWDSSDIREWSSKIKLAEQSLFASRTIIRIMTAGVEDKQLFSEDVLASLLGSLRRVVEMCIIAVVESRSDDSTFEIAHKNKDVLMPIFGSCTKMFSLLGNLFIKTDVDETAVTLAESLCRSLIFVENAAGESHAAVGIQTFEKLRRVAMDVFAKIFARHPDQRQSIFNDILTSLERLPVTRQSARQFRLIDTKPIQLVSALLMRLVQTSATRNQKAMRKTLEQDVSMTAGVESDESDAEADSDQDSDNSSAPVKRRQRAKIASTQRTDLEGMVLPLHEAASRDSAYIINFLVTRALSSSKSSDEPYRNLLDIFVEDFLNVLGNTDWPAAEMLLRHLVHKLNEIVSNNKSAAPAKAMALELMGSMLSGIIDLQLYVKEAFNKIAHEESPLADTLKQVHEGVLADDIQEVDILFIEGPWRAAIEYLRARPDSDSNVVTAMGYMLTQWGQLVVKPSDSSFDMPQPASRSEATLRKHLGNMIENTQNFDLEDDFPDVSTAEGRLGAALLTLRLPFCKHFNGIFSILLKSMSSDQASLRSKSLKSVDQVLDKDPSILDRGNFVLSNIVRSLSDSSPQVRDSALGLLTRCLSLRPALDQQAFEHVLARTADGNSTVKKRAMKLSKELYLRNHGAQIRSRIADALVHRISDLDESIIELARQTLEEIWIAPLHGISRSSGENVLLKVQLQEQASILVDTVNRSETIGPVLQDLLVEIMSAKSKSTAANIAVCKELVLAMLDGVIDENELPGKPSRAATMKALSIFAQARPKLFTAAQLKPLIPYLKNLENTDDLNVYRYTIIVARCILPSVSNLPQATLLETQQALLQSCSKLSSTVLKEVAACLRTVNDMIGDPERLIAVTRSALSNVQKLLGQNLEDANNIRKLSKLVMMVAHFTAAFDLDKHVARFKEIFPSYKGDSVVALALDIICPITSPKYPIELREVAIAGICRICHSWSKQYLRKDVFKALELVFASREPVLESVLMEAFRDFFGPAAERKAGDADAAKSASVKKEGSEAGADRITKTYIATDRDSASTALAQAFLTDIIRIALDSKGLLGLHAAHVVASVNRLGLVHPKESAPCLVALETSPDPAIAKIAFEEHRDLFNKHESMYEKENVRSIQQAFSYQRDIVNDPAGSTGTPPVPKLHHFWEVMKVASAKTRKRFLANICTRLDFEPAKLDMAGVTPEHVEFTRFCVENLAFFDYSKLDDLQSLIAGLEKIFSSTGTGVAHGIEALLMRRGIDQITQSQQDRNGHISMQAPTDGQGVVFSHEMNVGNAITTAPPIDKTRLRELTASAQILLLLWDTRTYLRRLWNLAKATPSGPRGRSAKDKAKEIARAPQRIPNSVNITDRYLTRNAEIVRALSSTDASQALCLKFQETISIDDEVKVAAEGDVENSMEIDEAAEGGYTTPSEDGSTRSGSVTPGKRGRKRKSATPGLGATPKKRKGSTARRSAGRDDWD